VEGPQGRFSIMGIVVIDPIRYGAGELVGFREKITRDLTERRFFFLL